MSVLEFIASLVRSVAWPAALVAVVIVLRQPLGDVLTTPLKRLKVGPAGFEAEWHEALQGVVRATGVSVSAGGPLDGSEFRREMLQLAQEASPSAAINASLSRVEEALRNMLAAQGVDGLEGSTAQDLVRRARNEGLVDDATVSSVDGLGVMRMLGVLDHGGHRLDMRHAEEFVTLADAVLFTLRMHASRDRS